jgi:hypothetical protein
MGEDRGSNGDRAETGRRLTVPEAAAEIRTTSEGVRSRIKRGTLRSVKEGGTVYVILEGAQPPPKGGPDAAQTGAQTGDRGELVEDLRERVAFLERELDRRGAAEAELRRIIAALTQRIPELEAPSETPGEPPESAAPRSDTHTPPEPEQGGERPWWRRMFGR